jgi:hypothetical protein
MKASSLLVALLALSCASGGSQNAGDQSSRNRTAAPSLAGISVHISGTNLNAATLMVGGTIGTMFELTVENGTSEPVIFHTVELQTYGSDSYELNTGRLTVRQTIAAGETAIIKLNALGRSPGGFISTRQPITIRGEANLEVAKKMMVRTFMDTVVPQ